jgi:primosomal replication protein N
VNQLQLQAEVDQMGTLRYTPAGVPALDMVLKHASQVQQAGQVRQVNLELRAQAFGTLAETLAHRPLGVVCGFNGFLTNFRNGKGVVFHIQDFNPI